MKITIICSDGQVGIDGVYRVIDLSALSSGVHAIQFNDETGAGHIEFDQSLAPLPPNEVINQAAYDEFFSWVIPAWEAAAPPPPPDPEPAPEPEPPVSVPLFCSPWQMRKALNASGLRTAIETAVAAADQDTKDGWEFATQFVRTDPLVIAMGAAIGKSEAEIDALFELAVTL